FVRAAPAPTEIHTLSLHDALPISEAARVEHRLQLRRAERLERLARDGDVRVKLLAAELPVDARRLKPALDRGIRLGVDALLDALDRKSTRLNSSHVKLSYAVFCLK